MRAGALRHRVLIETPTEAQGTIGGPDITWSTFDTIWASVEPLRGQEYLTGQQLSNKIKAKIVTRYRADITTKMRATWSGHVYDIVDIINVKGQNKTTELMCQEVS